MSCDKQRRYHNSVTTAEPITGCPPKRSNVEDLFESALQQIDLPKKLYRVIDHRVQLYIDPKGHIVKAKLPKDIRKAGLFSTRTMALKVCQSYLAKICTRKLSPALQSAYAEVGQFIRNAPVVGTDETGHKNPAYKSAWTWCPQTPEVGQMVVYFALRPGRAALSA